MSTWVLHLFLLHDLLTNSWSSLLHSFRNWWICSYEPSTSLWLLKTFLKHGNTFMPRRSYFSLLLTTLRHDISSLILHSNVSAPVLDQDIIIILWSSNFLLHRKPLLNIIPHSLRILSILCIISSHEMSSVHLRLATNKLSLVVDFLYRFWGTVVGVGSTATKHLLLELCLL